MHFFTSLTRMWLTRTVQPFTFRREYDQALPFAECESLGLYVHIPFCKSICNFCPYCKVRYSAELCERYIDSLIQEIHLVGSQHPGRKKATSLYFGGGTPALAAEFLRQRMIIAVFLTAAVRRSARKWQRICTAIFPRLSGPMPEKNVI